MASSKTTDYYVALEATTSIEDITVNLDNQKILRSLRDDDGDLSRLCVCCKEAHEHGDYRPENSEELGWLGHFAKKSTNLEDFALDQAIFENCSKQTVDRFFEDIGRCSHIKRMALIHDMRPHLVQIAHKLAPSMKKNNITHLSLKDCFLGISEANFLFDTLRDMKSLEELSISYDNGDYLLNDVDMAEWIPSLAAACTVMRTLKLSSLGLNINSCTALGALFPRMASLHKLTLHWNSIDDDCVEVLVRGLTECKHLHSLDLDFNLIGDDGLDMLVHGLPASVVHLDLMNNVITLAREIPLLRLKKLFLWGNTLRPGGPGVIAASLANPECHLEELYFVATNVKEEGATILAESLRSNLRLATLDLSGSNIAETEWNSFSSVLCDTTSINATYGSNHTLQDLGDCRAIPQDIKTLLELNSDQDKSRVAAKKILQFHRHLDMKPLYDREMDLLPYVVSWLERFAQSRLDHKLSSVFEFVRAMPMEVVDGFASKKNGKNRMRNSI